MTAYLTRRQREVLALAANGNSNREIARWLGRSPESVASLLSVVYRQLGARDRAQAVAVALRLELLDLDAIVLPEPAQRPAAGTGSGAAAPSHRTGDASSRPTVGP